VIGSFPSGGEALQKEYAAARSHSFMLARFDLEFMEVS